MPELTGPISGAAVLGSRTVGSRRWGPISGRPVAATLFGVSEGSVMLAGSVADGPHGAGRAKAMRSGFARLVNGATPVEAAELGRAATSRTR